MLVFFNIFYALHILKCRRRYWFVSTTCVVLAFRSYRRRVFSCKRHVLNLFQAPRSHVYHQEPGAWLLLVLFCLFCSMGTIDCSMGTIDACPGMCYYRWCLLGLFTHPASTRRWHHWFMITPWFIGVISLFCDAFSFKPMWFIPTHFLFYGRGLFGRNYNDARTTTSRHFLCLLFFVEHVSCCAWSPEKILVRARMIDTHTIRSWVSGAILVL